ncbi:hypothetical protein [Eggerthella sp. YY7918]|uniref:hypothetical protein n=1 Tax=Eggerthella sp. (strain YY7918) TaxID=502558 RepID=UPI00021710DC|nr:hypothetical protein [Eggerthella sp. YY7918]BAK43521.1 hypothetical protein EGYY_02850 [Eggerthella sp. YY7918]
MKKATDWIKSHKPHTAAIAIAIIAVVAVVIAAATGAFSTADKQNSTAKAETADLVLNVTADTGWDENSTPAIAHITGDDVDFYHAVSPDADGNKGTSTVTLEEGDYTVDFISPVNSDGSAYELFDTGEAQTVTVDADATDTLSVTCEMTRIPADKVTDDMLQDIVDQTKDAVENGDETLKGDAGKDILDKLEGNVANNPNASDETKQEATDADKEVDVNSQPEATTPSGNNGDTSDKGNANSNGNSGSNAGNSGSNSNGSGTSSKPSGGSSSQPSAPAHSHSWKDHTATKQVWVSNIVTVPDYETQQVFSHYLYVFSADGYSTTDINAVKAHSVELAKQGLSTNYSNVPQYTEQTVQVGSHTEDHGHYETQTYVDYQYCDCGATR